jgi:hypothetical protein
VCLFAGLRESQEESAGTRISATQQARLWYLFMTMNLETLHSITGNLLAKGDYAKDEVMLEMDGKTAVLERVTELGYSSKPSSQRITLRAGTPPPTEIPPR